MNRIFVYGTLMKKANHPMYGVLARNASFIGAGTIAGELYDLGSYPGVFIREGCIDRVIGEVYELNAETAAEAWRTLDAYEMCGPTDPEPHLYQKQSILVSLHDVTETAAAIYVLRTVPLHAVLIPGGDYLSRQAE